MSGIINKGIQPRDGYYKVGFKVDDDQTNTPFSVVWKAIDKSEYDAELTGRISELTINGNTTLKPMLYGNTVIWFDKWDSFDKFVQAMLQRIQRVWPMVKGIQLSYVEVPYPNDPVYAIAFADNDSFLIIKDKPDNKFESGNMTVIGKTSFLPDNTDSGVRGFELYKM